APPVFLDLQVHAELQQESDGRILVPAEARDPRVRGVLEHLVRGPRLPAEETQVDLGAEDARVDSILKDLPVVPGETAELLILDVSDRADDGDGRKVLVRRIQGPRHRVGATGAARDVGRSEEHTSELQSPD